VGRKGGYPQGELAFTFNDEKKNPFMVGKVKCIVKEWMNDIGARALLVYCNWREAKPVRERGELTFCW